MRLVDGEELYNIEKLLDTDIIQNSKEAVYLMSQVLHDIQASPTIDPETLPIVQELRAQLAQVTAERDALKSNPPVEIKSDAFELAMQLAQVTAERDAAVKLCGKLIALCSPPKEWEPKLFRRIINRPGDYMGCGYAFLDEFNRIFNEFVETGSQEIYSAIRESTEKRDT